ncbi:unnamed protein product [Spirodela intermedia]|uniref:Uncharacterized protein n=2 Tax=Spirodela intermedia TaxID=51605 RepID=A0A7I8KVC0_SPIIN|nr:unnamed protein product [Spirodela intermedia]CAA6665090.1 unnamed protein product [Spirodela intermedia]CAA7401750.1 unnamed protein product [Spirodela intermedia]
MEDWAPVFVSVVLFILLTPGLLFQLPGHERCVEFGSFQTSGAAIIIHSVIFFSLVALFLIALEIHTYFGR